jgi:hypothetical protein
MCAYTVCAVSPLCPPPPIFPSRMYVATKREERAKSELVHLSFLSTSILFCVFQSLLSPIFKCSQCERLARQLVQTLRCRHCYTQSEKVNIGKKTRQCVRSVHSVRNLFEKLRLKVSELFLFTFQWGLFIGVFRWNFFSPLFHKNCLY